MPWTEKSFDVDVKGVSVTIDITISNDKTGVAENDIHEMWVSIGGQPVDEIITDDFTNACWDKAEELYLK